MPNLPYDETSKEITRAAVQSADLSLLTAPAEREVIATLASAPQVLESALRALEPHRVAAWLRALAAAFSRHVATGAGRRKNSRFIVSDNRALSEARLALVLATRDGGLGEVFAFAWGDPCG